jgi:uncharacterized protein with GYD domain
MATFILLGKYSSGALQKMSRKRTDEAVDLVKKFGGEVVSMYALLGDKDLLLILDFPGIEEAMKASIALGKMTGIGFVTHPAVAVDKFDQLIEQI